MTADDLKALRGKLKMTQEQLAKRLGVKALTIIRWESGQTAIPRTVELAMKEIEREELG